MNSLALVLSAVTVIALAAVALGLMALWQTRCALRGASQTTAACGERCDRELTVLRAAVEACASQLRELDERPAARPALSAARPALNLGKRSQAIRMHRHGDPPELIAAALDIPRQEVDLLLKVHRIVISSLGN